jgi:predicted RNA methylase
MKSGEQNPDKELYRQLRALSCEELWEDEVPAFDRASPGERREKVSLVRAVGVVFSESGTAAQKDKARPWLRALLHDPCEKIRRYAMAALPKIGAGPGEEAELLSLLRTTTAEREKKFLGQTLEKIGGTATLDEMTEAGLHLQTEQKIRASVARSQSPSIVRMDRTLSDFAELKIHLRGRAGLEEIVRDEVEEAARKHGKFRVAEVRTGLVVFTPVAPFSLGDIYALRCFGTVGFVLGNAGGAEDAEFVERLASLITSPLSRRLLETFTEGSIRYRLDFVTLGHQRGAVRLVVNRAYAMCPAILNDARSAPWTIAIHPAERGNSVELSPKFTPDPRLYFRKADVPAASHPPLAACMARLAGRRENEIVWDPFCGSGLELIERALLGGVRSVHGTDRSMEAVEISRANFAAANLKGVRAEFTCCDFRDFAAVAGLGPESVTLVISNPPLGKRVPIADLRGLIGDLFSAAATVLTPGGRLVFANPLRIENPHRKLKLQSRQVVDFSGFDCRLEKYLKLPR